MSRKKLIAGNWKMHKTPAETRAFLSAFLPLIQNHSRDEIVVCPPAVCLSAAAEMIAGTRVKLGGQNIHDAAQGAFTGETSAEMLVAVGCSHVILGHSERRQYFQETDAFINRKIKSALATGLTPIVCLGEMLEERESGRTEDVLRRHCAGAFQGLSDDQLKSLTIAYEPVWAIGTGKTATPQLAAEAHAFIRAEVRAEFGDEIARKVRILYGGSVKPENAAALMEEPELDGALVGGASLDPESFATIVKY